MSDIAHHDGDEGDWQAAQFALGLLEGDALVQAASRLRTDADFAAQVAHWQMQLSDMDGEFAEVAAPAAVKKALVTGLFGAQPSLLVRLWNSTPLWRGVAAFGVLAALFMSFNAPVTPPALTQQNAQLITALFAPGGEVAFVTRFDAERGVLRVSRLAGEAGPGQDLQMWFAPTPDARAVSMGVVPEAQVYEIELTPELIAQMTTEAHFGISIEQEGGSPTGQPTDVLVIADTLAI